MILSRLFSLILRFAEFVSAVVVLGLIANFLHLHEDGGSSKAREIYTIIWAVISAILALVWMFPTVHHMLHVPADFVLSLGWFAVSLLSLLYILTRLESSRIFALF
jgi:hypothetical protein